MFAHPWEPACLWYRAAVQTGPGPLSTQPKTTSGKNPKGKCPSLTMAGALIAQAPGDLLPRTLHPRGPPTYHLRPALPTTHHVLPTIYHRPPTTHDLLPTTGYLQPSAEYRRPTIYLLLPSTYYLELTVYYLLPATRDPLLVVQVTENKKRRATIKRRDVISGLEGRQV